MKKIFLTTVFTSVGIFCLPFFGLSQTGNDAVAYQHKAISDDLSGYGSVNSSSKIRANDVNIRALRDFTKKFRNVSNVEWYQASDGFIARFTENGTETKVIMSLTVNGIACYALTVRIKCLWM